MPDRQDTRLSGHTLYAEGKPCVPDAKYAYNLVDGPVGRGLCSCGEQSPELGSNSARRRWHRDHKEAVRRAQ